ncbi:uncharacterized protein LOC121978558 [Zingiber officinale]|uniref:uncharacterized protein LOC121978558 n=1 Tax=Zingiber officinale TaxID=94328 RepID=UPI001C4B4B38|nr:uncharacterized protein LOC121978558 [Zingiber officinale]
MVAKDLLKEKRPYIFLTACAVNTMNLMLQGIGNQPKFKGVIEKTKNLTIFIDAYHKTLSMMRKFTKKKGIVRPGVTRLTTTFLTLQNLMEKKIELRYMVASEEWNACKYLKSVKGKVFAPLVKLLRLVDGNKKSSMGFVYGELLRSIGSEEVATNGLFTCVESFFTNNIDSQSEVVNVELLKYINKAGGFGRPLAIIGYTKHDEKYDPVGWWHLFGHGAPKLQKMAKRILSLTTSSSGYEKNWSIFEGIINKKKRQEEKGVDVLLASKATMVQGWIVDSGDEDVETNIVNVKELYKEEFVSYEEEEDAMDFEFESDIEKVLEKYGDELE